MPLAVLSHLHKAPPPFRNETTTLHTPTTPRVHSRVAPRVTNGYIIYTEAILVYGRLQLEEAHVQHGAPKWQLWCWMHHGTPCAVQMRVLPYAADVPVHVV